MSKKETVTRKRGRPRKYQQVNQPINQPTNSQSINQPTKDPPINPSQPTNEEEKLDEDFVNEIRELAENGFKPYIRNYYGQKIITMRSPTTEKRIGEYDDDKWELVNKIAEEHLPKKPEKPISKGPFKISKDVPIINISGRDLQLWDENYMFYAWAKQAGYTGTLSDFINEVMKNYQVLKGIIPAVILTEKEEETENG